MLLLARAGRFGALQQARENTAREKEVRARAKKQPGARQIWRAASDTLYKSRAREPANHHSIAFFFPRRRHAAART